MKNVKRERTIQNLFICPDYRSQITNKAWSFSELSSIVLNQTSWKSSYATNFQKSYVYCFEYHLLLL